MAMPDFQAPVTRMMASLSPPHKIPPVPRQEAAFDSGMQRVRVPLMCYVLASARLMHTEAAVKQKALLYR